LATGGFNRLAQYIGGGGGGGGGGGRRILVTMLHGNADCSNGTCTGEAVLADSVVSRYLTAVWRFASAQT
jgi:hypothetical protein